MTSKFRMPPGFALAIEILEALGVPKELNVSEVTLRLSFSGFPTITVDYSYYPDPIRVGEDLKIVTVLKKCKLVELEGITVEESQGGGEAPEGTGGDPAPEPE